MVCWLYSVLTRPAQTACCWLLPFSQIVPHYSFSITSHIDNLAVKLSPLSRAMFQRTLTMHSAVRYVTMVWDGNTNYLPCFSLITYNKRLWTVYFLHGQDLELLLYKWRSYIDQSINQSGKCTHLHNTTHVTTPGKATQGWNYCNLQIHKEYRMRQCWRLVVRP